MISVGCHVLFVSGCFRALHGGEKAGLRRSMKTVAFRESESDFTRLAN